MSPRWPVRQSPADRRGAGTVSADDRARGADRGGTQWPRTDRVAAGSGELTAAPDPMEPLSTLLRDLRTSRAGLSTREAERRLLAVGANELSRRRTRQWPAELVAQFTHPLALLLAVAAALSLINRTPRLAIAIVAVILINAALAFAQEMQAERAVEALASYLPPRARALRDGMVTELDARDLVPGDVVLIDEGERISADGRLVDGAIEADMSTLTGESQPVTRVPVTQTHTCRCSRRPTSSSPATCTPARRGGCHGDRDAHRTRPDRGPLGPRRSRQRAARAAGPAGGPVDRRGRHRHGELVPAARPRRGVDPRRCAELLDRTAGRQRARGPTADDHTGARGRRPRPGPPRSGRQASVGGRDPRCHERDLHRQDRHPHREPNASGGVWTGPVRSTSRAACSRPSGRAWFSNSPLQARRRPCKSGERQAGRRPDRGRDRGVGYPGGCPGRPVAEAQRRKAFPSTFGWRGCRRSMPTIGGRLVLHTKGAPETVLPLCNHLETVRDPPFDRSDRNAVDRQVDGWAAARTPRPRDRATHHRPGEDVPGRQDAEINLCLLGLVAMFDPPRPEVARRDRPRHRADPDPRRDRRPRADRGGDRPPGRDRHRRGGAMITGRELDAMTDSELDDPARSGTRSSSRAARPRQSCGSPTRCVRWVTSSR